MSDSTTNQPGRATFNIVDWKGFHQKLREEFDEVKKQPHSTRHALNFAFTAWHMQDWLWKNLLAVKKGVGLATFGREFRSKKAFEAYILRACPDMAIVGAICNSGKHFTYDARDIGRTIAAPRAYGSGNYGTLPYSGGLYIAPGDGAAKSFLSIAEAVTNFWNQTLATAGIHQ